MKVSLALFLLMLFAGLSIGPLLVQAQDVNVENWRQHFVKNQCDKSNTRLEPSTCVCDVESDSLGYGVAVGFNREHNGDRLMIYESMINLSHKTVTVPENKAATSGPIYVSIWNANGEKLLSDEEIWKRECAARTGTPCIANIPLSGRAFWSDGRPSDKLTPGASSMGARPTDYTLKTSGAYQIRVVRNLIVDNRKIVFVFNGIKLDVKRFDESKEPDKSNHLKSFEGLRETLQDAKSDRLFLSDVLAKIETIKRGMTREDLLKVMGEEGGISTRNWRTYVFPSWPIIKVEVEFKPFGNPSRDAEGRLLEGEDKRDVITKISKPFFELQRVD